MDESNSSKWQPGSTAFLVTRDEFPTKRIMIWQRANHGPLHLGGYTLTEYLTSSADVETTRSFQVK